jgi:hemolysin III
MINTVPARSQTPAEELANAISHGVGVALAIAALPLLVWFADRHGSAADITAAVLFGASMVLLYGTSTLYHALRPGRAKSWFQRLDHAAIYVFIAGSYTPFTLGPLRGGWGWSLFGVVWGLAVVGVLLKLLNRLRHPLWSTGLYVAMGWLALVAAVPMLEHIATGGIVLLVAGGVAYTVGAVFFLVDHRLRYGHFVWHLFVLAGTACHFAAVLEYAAVS